MIHSRFRLAAAVLALALGSTPGTDIRDVEIRPKRSPPPRPDGSDSRQQRRQRERNARKKR